MQHRDWVGTWYELLEETGEFCGIRFGKCLGGDPAPQWSYLPHKTFDGIGGFAQLLRQQYPGVQLDLPRLKCPSPPSFYGRTKAFFQHVAKKQSVSSYPLVFEEPGVSAGEPNAVAWVVISQEATTDLQERARAVGVSLNSLLLWALASATTDELAQGQDQMLWTIPVNMRGGVATKPETSNHAAFIELLLSGIETPQTVHAAVRLGFEKNDHWGAWLALSFGRTLGIRGMRRRLKSHGALFKTGIFSNLGSWNVAEQSFAKSGPVRWLFSPPVFRTHPAAAGALVFNGQLSLALQLHQGLATSEIHAQQWLNRWIRNLEVPQDATAAT